MGVGIIRSLKIAVEDYGYQSAALFAIISGRRSLNK